LIDRQREATQSTGGFMDIIAHGLTDYLSPRRTNRPDTVPVKTKKKSCRRDIEAILERRKLERETSMGFDYLFDEK